MTDWPKYDEFFEFMAQREDAKDEGNEAEYHYWRGYIDCIADTEGYDEQHMAEAERAFKEMCAWAEESMDDAARAARHRNAATTTATQIEVRPLRWESRGVLGGWRSVGGVESFTITKRGSLPSMIAWDLFHSDERIRAFRTLREAKARASEMNAEFAASREP